MGLADEEKNEGIIGGADFLRAMQAPEPPKYTAPWSWWAEAIRPSMRPEPPSGSGPRR